MVFEQRFSNPASFMFLELRVAWPELISPCLWEDASIILQLGFLLILLLYFFRKNVDSLSEGRKVMEVEKYPTGVRYGLSFKLGTVCSLLMLSTHVVTLLMSQRKTGTQCESRLSVLSSRIIHVISWIITLITLHKIWKRKYIKFPWILRFWWTFSFLLSLARAMIDAHLIMKNHDKLTMQEYADIINFLASVCLLGISIQGKTGSALSVSDDITEPLVRGNNEKHSEVKRDNLYGKASLVQLVTFSWLNPLFEVGFKKPLDQDEVPDVDIKDSASFLSRGFDQCLKYTKETDGTEMPSIYKAVYIFGRKKAAINALFAVTSAATSYVGPYLINYFVEFLNEKKLRSLSSGYLLALGFLGAKLVETIAQRQWIFGARQLGLRLRAALISHIYKKGLILSSQSRRSRTSGEIINLMSVDVQRITDFIWYLNTVWMLPVQISLAIYVLHTNLGMGAFVALAATLTVMAGNIPLTRVQKRYQTKIMEAKDDRMNATSEVLRNMKTLKLQAWDSYYLQNLVNLRKTEHNWLWKSLRLSALSAFIFWGSPAFISVITFGGCLLMGIPLTAGRVLSALATFRMLQDPIFNLPDLLNVIAQGKVSVDRISTYQDADIYLLDDPFSAVDAHTGTQLFQNCLMGILKEKTILYVTHQVEFLPAADLILVCHKEHILTTVKGGALVPIIILAQSSFQVLQIASNYWMAWSCPTGSDVPTAQMDFVLFIYTLLAVGSAFCVLIRASLVAIAGLLTAEKLFSKMLNSVIHAPMTFFDSTPAGRILNRASTDQSVVDSEMATKLGWCAFSVIQLLGTIAVMSQVAWEVFVIFIPVTAICIWYQVSHCILLLVLTTEVPPSTARELARLAGIQRAPILHHFAESLSGAATIRAFDQQERFTDANLCLIDNHSRPWFHNVSAMEWLSFRLNQLSNFVFAFSLVLLVSLHKVMLSIAYHVPSSKHNLASEAPLVIEDSRPPPNCTFPGRKKVGVVGRTGSGKSTLIQAIFRIVEPREGSIIIDDVDISKIGLHDLRSRLSIIPQDPTMFEGTVRGNLDPLEQYSDTEIWEALDKCQLGDIVRQKPEKLESTVVENGENWSVGQRQLFCLGRALLKKISILVLDEATASVDSATDGVIQRIISREFSDRTVVTIAHRIHTVIDSDYVLVLSDGRIAEYDTPAKLLERENSFFSKLIKEYSMRSQCLNSTQNLQY